MAQLSGILLWMFVILTTIAIVFFLPLVMLLLALEWRRSRPYRQFLAVAACVAIGFLAGGFLGWAYLPFPRSLSFVDTLRANFADHSIEYYAERILFFVLMTGSAGAWAAGLASAVVTRRGGGWGPQVREA